VPTRLKQGESGTHGARRIARQRIKSALRTLDRRNKTDRSVHLARKELKRARATLRLLRDALGRSTYKKENAALREVASPLSAVRDGRVLLDALRSLIDYYGAPAAALPLGKFQRSLIRRRSQLRSSILEKRAPLREARKSLRAAQTRAAHWHVGRHGWSVLGAGLKRTYGRARRALQKVLRQASDEHLHEWRKQTKYFWYQLQIFTPLAPGPIGELESAARKLADFLGDDHDLAVLHARVLQSRALFPSAASQRALESLIERCRAGLQAKALLLGQQLYAEPPAELVARLGECWHEWRGRRGHRSVAPD